MEDPGDGKPLAEDALAPLRSYVYAFLLQDPICSAMEIGRTASGIKSQDPRFSMVLTEIRVSLFVSNTVMMVFNLYIFC